MKIYFLLNYIIILLKTYNIISQTDIGSLEEQVDRVERYLKELRTSYLHNFNKKCSFLIEGKEHSVFHACSDPNSSFKRNCDTKFGNVRCQSCATLPGMLLNKEFTHAKIADKYSKSTDYNDPTIQQLIIPTIEILPQIKEIQEFNNGDTIKWVYFGTSSGVWINYPGFKFCDPYDPRVRPWYIASASGPKNLILIVDISGSMANAGKWELVKKSINFFLDSTVTRDFIGLVTFNEKAESNYSNVLKPATEENKARLLAIINEIEVIGNTNYEAAFKKANLLLKDSKADPNLNGGLNTLACRDVLVFLTDGQPTTGVKDSTKLFEIIKKDYPLILTSTLFIYSFGDDAALEIPKALSCSLNGLYTHVRVNTNLNLIESLSNYLSILELGVENQNPTWVEPYEDASGIGIVTTCSLPVYEKINNEIVLLGVWGIDLLMKDLYAAGGEAKVLEFLTIRSRSGCTNPQFSLCQLNNFRKETNKCKLLDGETCDVIRTQFIQCPADKAVPQVFANFYDPENKPGGSDCCGYDFCANMISIIIPVVIVVVIAVSIGIIIHCLKINGKLRKKKVVKPKDDEDDDEKIENEYDDNGNRIEYDEDGNRV